mmetsp:Transcript_10256/g.43604  ORF Transcript_10256/g.43604 Transcript_10256/m.43604 type:complete len:229 (-) Transcript_10256:132-818(-)
MIVEARLRACDIFASARFFLRNFASATFLMERVSTAARRSFASARSFSSYTGGGRMNLRSSSRNHSGRSSSSSRAYLLYASSKMRSLSFFLIMFLPIARISAFSPSLMSSGSLSVSDPEDSELASGSAGASRNPALSFPRRARPILVPTGSAPLKPAPPSSSDESVSSSYVSSYAFAARFLETPPFVEAAFFFAFLSEFAFASSRALVFAAFASSLFAFAADATRIAS